MFRYLILCLAGLCLWGTATAQSTTGPAGDAIYFTNGNRYKNAQLVEVNASKVKFTVKRGDALTNYSQSRNDVLLAFTQEGNYLIISEISDDLRQADQQLKDFLMAPARTAPTDLMIRRAPLEVLRGLISYESDDVVNYQPATGGAASVSKSELLMILYRDGKHYILTDPNEIAPILTELRPQLNANATPAAALVPVAEPVAVVTPPPAPVKPTRSSRPAPRSVPKAPAPETAAPVTTAVTPAAAPTPVAATPAEAPAAGSKPVMSETDYVTYRAKAMQRVDEFISYINIITDKSLTADDKDRAIEQALNLFMPGATIAVTSASKPNPPRVIDVRTYLIRLKLLPYTYTKVGWTEVQYLKELTQAPDGNYYGIITGQQRFEGYDKADAVTYSDVTQKNVRVKLQPGQKNIDGQNETFWKVLLGNVGVGSN